MQTLTMEIWIMELCTMQMGTMGSIKNINYLAEIFHQALTPPPRPWKIPSK